MGRIERVLTRCRKLWSKPFLDACKRFCESSKCALTSDRTERCEGRSPTMYPPCIQCDRYEHTIHP